MGRRWKSGDTGHLRVAFTSALGGVVCRVNFGVAIRLSSYAIHYCEKAQFSSLISSVSIAKKKVRGVPTRTQSLSYLILLTSQQSDEAGDTLRVSYHSASPVDPLTSSLDLSQSFSAIPLSRPSSAIGFWRIILMRSSISGKRSTSTAIFVQNRLLAQY